jgi:CHASE3 domain sensor protein
MDPKDFIHLLVEIRDIQREHLEEYRRVTGESLELQRQAVRRQEKLGRLYQRVVAVGALVLVAMGLFLAWLVGAFP